jgi:hypothetical protein
MLAMLEPNKSPTARSTAPNFTANRSVPSSGREVAPASNIEPIQSPPMPVADAIWSERARLVPARTMATPLPRNTIK